MIPICLEKTAQTTPQNILMARHMSLPPNSVHPDQFMNQGDIIAEDSNANPSTSNLGGQTSEDDLTAQKTKKKGMMSLFKRNK